MGICKCVDICGWEYRNKDNCIYYMGEWFKFCFYECDDEWWGFCSCVMSWVEKSWIFGIDCDCDY